jgi:hypothetical protein
MGKRREAGLASPQNHPKAPRWPGRQPFASALSYSAFSSTARKADHSNLAERGFELMSADIGFADRRQRRSARHVKAATAGHTRSDCANYKHQWHRGTGGRRRNFRLLVGKTRLDHALWYSRERIEPEGGLSCRSREDDEGRSNQIGRSARQPTNRFSQRTQ